jgi:hypothetical protein
MYKSNNSKQYDLVGIALSGAYAKAKNVSLTGGKDLASMYHYLKEGGYVIDKRSCDQNQIIDGAYRGAMVDFALSDNLQKCTWESDVPKPCANYKDAGALDYVSFNLYRDFWRSLGARIGKRVADSIVWENGEIEQIVVYED